MKIGTFPGRGALTAWRLPGVLRRYRFLALFLGYNLLLVGAGVTMFYTTVNDARRQRILRTMVERSRVKEIWRKLGYAIRGEAKPPEPVAIDMAPADWQALNATRSMALREGLKAGERAGVFPVSIGYYGQRLSGEITLEEEDGAWPMVVRLKGEGDLLGMKAFNLYPSRDGNLLDEWVMSGLFADMGAAGRRQDLVLADFGAGNRQVYFLRENVEDSEPDFSAAGQRFSRVFDQDKLAAHLAMLELTGRNRYSSLDSLHFRRNARNALAEPLLIQAGPPGMTEDNGLLGASKNGGRFLLEEGVPTAGHWAETAFGDEHFFRAYIRALEKIASETYLDDYFLRHERELIAREKALKRAGMSGSLDCRAALEENHRFIGKALRPAKLLQPYFRKDQTTGSTVCIDVQNIHNLPVEVLGASIGDSIPISLSGEGGLLPGSRPLEPLPTRTLRFSLPKGMVWADSLLAGLTVRSRILGAERVVKDAVIPYALEDQDLLAGDLIRQEPNFRDFAFIQVDEAGRQITLAPGLHRLDKNLTIPGGYQVMAGPGVRIDMVNHAHLISYSPFMFEGAEGNPVSIFSSDSTAQGIVIFGADEESLLRYVHLDNLSIPSQTAWSLTAAITFYESPVHIDHCLFNRNRTGDDFLNIVRTRYIIENTLFRFTNADAFDGDFSDGVVRRTRFEHPGNDGIDVSGSHVTVEDVVMEDVGDKAISIGENSSMEGRRIRIRNAELAITAKDLSRIVVDDVQIADSRVGYVLFQKKPEYGPANITVTRRSEITGKTDIAYLIEPNSRLTIAGQEVASSVHVDRVREILYGVKFGKASR